MSATAAAHAALLRMRTASVFAPRSADELAVLDADRQRTADHHATLADIERDAQRWDAPLSGVSTDHYREHIERTAQRGPGAGWFGGWRSGDHIEQAAPANAPARTLRTGDDLADYSRYAVHASTGGSLYDGGAWAIATHSVTVDAQGREHIERAPAAVYVAAVAQPADVRAMRLRSVRWFGGTGRVEDPDAGALADRGHSTREAGHALVGPDGCNLTRITSDAIERERWVHVRGETAVALHRLAGTEPSAHILDADRLAIVGAMPGEPRRWETRYGIAVDIEEHHSDGTIERRTAWRTRPLSDAERSMWGDVGVLAHTARYRALPRREDPRSEAEREARTPGRRQARQEAARFRRLLAAHSVAVEAMAVGEPILSGRRDALPRRLTEAAVLSAALCGVSPLDVLSGAVLD